MPQHCKICARDLRYMHSRLRGSIVPLVTPFTRDGEVDEEALRSLIRFQMKSGSHGISVAGTTGEPSSLTHAERERLFQIAVEEAHGKIPVVAGTGTNNLQETLRFTRAAEKAGVDAVLVIVPYYIRPSQHGLFEYFSAVASSTSLPLIIYNIPGRTACNIEPATVWKLRQKHDNIVGIKESNRDLDQVSNLLLMDSELLVYCGIESLCFPMLALGGAGHFSATANILPAEVAALYNLVQEGKWEEARKMHYRLLKISEAIFWETNPVPLKAALGMMGLITPTVRLPLAPLSEEKREALRMLLTEYGIRVGGIT